MQLPLQIGAAPDSLAAPQELQGLESASLEELMRLFSAAIADETATARAIELFHRSGSDPAALPALRAQLKRATCWTQAIDAAIARQFRSPCP